jgi:glucose/arabinose dehydrogenase
MLVVVRRELAAALLVGFCGLHACSRGGDAATPGMTDDGGSPDGGGPDSVAPGPTPPPLPTRCDHTDIAPVSKKFCALPGQDAPDLKVPPEFCVREFTAAPAHPVKEARVIRFAPNGDLFVAAPSVTTVGGASDGPGQIVVLPDDNGDGVADSVVTYAGAATATGGFDCTPLEVDPGSMACVHGLAFSGGYLYFTRSNELRRFAYTSGNRAAPGPSELVATLGADFTDARWTHGLDARADGSLVVGRGRYDTDGCDPDQLKRGSVFVVHPERPLPLVPDPIAHGFRNPMYLRCAPTSCNDCWASELSGESWDDVGGREKLALLYDTGSSINWGYPCCVAPNMPAPGWPNAPCSDVTAEPVAIKLHDTNFGLDFERGGFPDPYRHGVFVALHGVLTSFGGTAVVWLPTDPATLRPNGAPKVFVSGFGQPNGRATDVAFAPDGRLFIADDTMGKIYWVAPK